VIATATELAVRVQQDVDTATATLLLDIAEDLIIAEAGDLGANGGTWPPRLKGVQLDAAARAYINPSGVNHELFETYSRSGIPQGGVYLTDDEKQRCRAARRVATTSGLVSVALVTPAEHLDRNLTGVVDPFYGFTGDWP
jgi:hypothetical protein